MKLYNQTKNPLRWKIGMTTFTCDAWGEVDVPDMFVLHCKTRGLPLNVSPVAAEIKADQTLANANEAARKDELLALQHELALARAAEGSAKGELEKVLQALADTKRDALSSKTEASDTKRKFDLLVTDHAALNQLLEEQTKLTVTEKLGRERAEATVAELKKAPAAPEAKPAKK